MASGARDHERVQSFARSPGSTDQFNVTASTSATTTTFSATTSSLLILNNSGQVIQYSLDGGTTFSDLNPYVDFSADVAVDSIQTKKKTGHGDANVIIIATHGKA